MALAEAEARRTSKSAEEGGGGMAPKIASDASAELADKLRHQQQSAIKVWIGVCVVFCAPPLSHLPHLLDCYTNTHTHVSPCAPGCPGGPQS